MSGDLSMESSFISVTLVCSKKILAGWNSNYKDEKIIPNITECFYLFNYEIISLFI